MTHARHQVPLHQALRRLEVRLGDITRCYVDAIVNAANESLLGGGGVDGAIHQAAGPGLAEECRALSEVSPGVRCPPGEACITSGFELPARFVIHTVGPVWRGGGEGERELLASCYSRAVELAVRHQLSTLAFPAISTGIFRYPLEAACEVAVTALASALSTATEIDSVVLVAFDKRTEQALARAVRNAAPPRP
jgi:O-acetyl-ADP-ribose deacetylase (regulator of RNase III)